METWNEFLAHSFDPGQAQSGRGSSRWQRSERGSGSTVAKCQRQNLYLELKLGTPLQEKAVKQPSDVKPLFPLHLRFKIMLKEIVPLSMRLTERRGGGTKQGVGVRNKAGSSPQASHSPSRPQSTNMGG